MNQTTNTSHLAIRPYSRLNFDLIFEIPLALLSFLWFKLVKLVIAITYGMSLLLNRKFLTHWHIFSDQTLQIPIVLPVVMTQGPRWNPHTIVVSVGPFRVEKDISMDLNALRRSTPSWTVVVYRYPSYHTVSYISALDTSEADSPKQPNLVSADHTHPDRYNLTCSAGLYCLGLRLFETEDTLDLPEVKIDGQININSKQVPSEKPSYQTLKKHHNWFYLSLHYYVFTMLRLRPWLPESFIKQEYLPVGNPDTTFLYDYLRKRDTLCIQLPPSFLENYYIYLITYTRSSLPLDYCTITQQTYTTDPMTHNGFYLIRVRPKHQQVSSVDRTSINLTVTRT